MKISVGSDHGGWQLKEELKNYLISNKPVEIIDRGCYSDERCDYPDYGHLVANDIKNGECDFGILICTTGNGINMTANKWKEVRSALCWNSNIAKMARLHNDANVLTLPGGYISLVEAINCVIEFMDTEFEGGRHENRVKKISKKKIIKTSN